MLDWLARGILFLSGILVGVFLPREDAQFEIVTMIVAIALMVVVLATLAFWHKSKKK